MESRIGWGCQNGSDGRLPVSLVDPSVPDRLAW